VVNMCDFDCSEVVSMICCSRELEAELLVSHKVWPAFAAGRSFSFGSG
jgi:hypothetical protein